MMKNVNLSDTELAAYSGEHLLYELQYLWFTANELRNLSNPQPMASVLIESFGIHLRNLIDFFCTPIGTERDHDVIASDFCPGWSESISGTLKDAKERANKELSHLTLARKHPTDPAKSWDINGLFNEVMDVANRFVAKTPQTKLSGDVPKWLQIIRVPKTTMSVPMLASNTTATMVISAPFTIDKNTGKP
jgi:hypothetical protein